MHVIDAISVMLAASDVSKRSLAKHLGRKSTSVYNMFRKRSDIKLSTLLGVCEATGYRVELVNDNGDRIFVDSVDPE